MLFRIILLLALSSCTLLTKDREYFKPRDCHYKIYAPGEESGCPYKLVPVKPVDSTQTK